MLNWARTLVHRWFPSSSLLFLLTQLNLSSCPIEWLNSDRLHEKIDHKHRVCLFSSKKNLVNENQFQLFFLSIDFLFEKNKKEDIEHPNVQSRQHATSAVTWRCLVIEGRHLAHLILSYRSVISMPLEWETSQTQLSVEERPKPFSLRRIRVTQSLQSIKFNRIKRQKLLFSYTLQLDWVQHVSSIDMWTCRAEMKNVLLLLNNYHRFFM